MMAQPAPENETPRRSFLDHLRLTLLAGLVLALPLVVTIWVVRLVIFPLDGFLQPIFERAIGRHIPGLGLVTLLVFFYIAGLIGRNVAGRMFFGFLESAFLHIPIARSIYYATKDLLAAFSPEHRARSFREVCLVEYPRVGVFAMGFVTGRVTLRAPGEPAEQEMRTVYIPNPPNPATGNFIIVPAAQVHPLDISVEEGLKMVLSGGIVAPTLLRLQPARTIEPAP